MRRSISAGIGSAATSPKALSKLCRNHRLKRSAWPTAGKSSGCNPGFSALSVGPVGFVPIRPSCGLYRGRAKARNWAQRCEVAHSPLQDRSLHASGSTGSRRRAPGGSGHVRSTRRSRRGWPPRRSQRSSSVVSLSLSARRADRRQTRSHRRTPRRFQVRCPLSLLMPGAVFRLFFQGWEEEAAAARPCLNGRKTAIFWLTEPVICRASGLQRRPHPIGWLHRPKWVHPVPCRTRHPGKSTLPAGPRTTPERHAASLTQQT